MNKGRRGAITIFLVIVAIIIILALYGYFTGAWEKPEGVQNGNRAVFTNQQAGWSENQGNTSS